MIGNAKYQCSCVRYVTHSNTPLIIGLCVGLGLLLIIIIVAVIVIIVLRRHQNKPPSQGDIAQTSIDLDETMQYNRRLPGDYQEQGTDYSRQLPEDYQGADTGYNKRLPGDYVETGADNDYDRQLP